MSPAVVDIALVAGSLAGYAVAYVLVLRTTRPARVPAGPASPDLGEEPPAVASLLANRWRLNENASESTLLDLAARGHFELRQPGNEPRHTTIHLREASTGQALTSYEIRVRDRIAALATNGVVPIMALTFRNARQAKRWHRRLHREVVADARARGLSRRRMDPTAVGILVAMAAVSAVCVALVMFLRGLREGNADLTPGFVIGALVFGALAALARGPAGERDTPRGREVAARWLGVREWLRGHEEFADVPPAGVSVWDRYLGYGVALGVTRVASDVLDLGMGSRRLIWSSYGGTWQKVRVRYPRFWPRYGDPVSALVLRSFLALVLVVVLNAALDVGLPETLLPTLPQRSAGVLETVKPFLPYVSVLLLAYSVYVPVRTVLDLSRTRTITGEVLWVGTWRARYRREERRTIPWLEYVAIYDGEADKVTAWALPSGSTTQPRARDIVTVRVRPWSRRVVELRLVDRASL